MLKSKQYFIKIVCSYKWLTLITATKLVKHFKLKEQIKAKRAEESARKVCARQEERVALLESKLAELSETVGQYDLRRRHDLQLIQQLKESLNGRLMDKIAANNDYGEI